MNKSRGFTLVELLATITIMGILSATAAIAYNIYQRKAINQAYESMIIGAGEAAEEYFMEHNANKVSFQDLVNYNYLSNNDDPADKNNTKGCQGIVNKISSSNAASKNSIEKEEYVISIKCTNYSFCTKYPIERYGEDEEDEEGKIKEYIGNECIYN